LKGPLIWAYMYMPLKLTAKSSTLSSLADPKIYWKEITPFSLLIL
jgi:hypothetical protein